jgi:hypothetical protein
MIALAQQAKMKNDAIGRRVVSRNLDRVTSTAAVGLAIGIHVANEPAAETAVEITQKEMKGDSINAVYYRRASAYNPL